MPLFEHELHHTRLLNDEIIQYTGLGPFDTGSTPTVVQATEQADGLQDDAREDDRPIAFPSTVWPGSN